MNSVKIAKEIIKSNIYLSLATSEGEMVWIAPLYYAVKEHTETPRGQTPRSFTASGTLAISLL